MASAVINQPLRDVSIDTSAVTLCALFRHYVATSPIKYNDPPIDRVGLGYALN
jgi:hypothetical protein